MRNRLKQKLLESIINKGYFKIGSDFTFFYFSVCFTAKKGKKIPRNEGEEGTHKTVTWVILVPFRG